jgi:hypothetical protein
VRGHGMELYTSRAGPSHFIDPSRALSGVHRAPSKSLSMV